MGLLYGADWLVQFLSKISRSGHGAHLLHQVWPLPPDDRGQFLRRPRRPYEPTVITKVSLEHTSDGGHCEADERALMWIEPPTGFDQPGAGDLQEVFLILAAMRKPACQHLRKPEMGSDHVVEDPLAFDRICSLGLNEEVVGMFGE